ncbi:MAG: lactate utilization protein [Oscillospiraceae bacterium]|nr:lactate utilization protein [Oscillospiraceae bacterium]
MNSFAAQIYEKRIEKTVENLKKNNFNACFVKSKEELLEKIKQIVPQGGSVAWGGSATLKETGVVDMLKNGGYVCYDRTQPGMPADEYKEVSLKAFSADVFLAGTNAVTEQGELYNVDGNGNRVAPMIYGPDKVIVVVGKNKIVPDIEAAKVRVQKLAAPANGVRLNTGTPCSVTGECVGGLGCRAPKRMCCTSTVFGFQRDTERFYVFITEEDFGF